MVCWLVQFVGGLGFGFGCFVMGGFLFVYLLAVLVGCWLGCCEVVCGWLVGC